jgi:uncharacterized membrane protein YkoI
MRRVRACLGAVTVLTVVVVLAAPLARGAEEQVVVSQVPKPVMDAVKARFAGASVTDAGKQTEKGQLVYEVTVVEKGQNVDVTLSPGGEILMIEKAINVADLPMAVTKALKDDYPGATYRIVEEIVEVEKKQERLAYYEVRLVAADKRAMEVQMTPDGKKVTEEEDMRFGTMEDIYVEQGEEEKGDDEDDE